MKSHIAWLAILALTSIPAWAQWTYDNGPINGTTDAWTINFGYMVSDTFVAGPKGVAGFQFGVWELASAGVPPCVRCSGYGDTLVSLPWSITSAEDSGTVYGSGVASAGSNLTDQFISTNQYGYDIDLITVSGLNVPTTSGTKYWLNLYNAVTKFGDPVYWDENSGRGCGGTGCPSQASESSLGTIPSEAFTVNGCSPCGCFSSCAFGPSTVPEPGSILLFGSGVLGLAGVLRRKVNL